MILSHDGEVHTSANKRFNEMVIFVHHFGGSKIAMRRHIELVNSLGFDAVSFNLTDSKISHRKLPFLGTEKFGNRRVWSEDIYSVTKDIDRPLIFYSFSFPSCGVAKYFADNSNLNIKGWICDGGPFINMRENYWNYFTFVTPIKNKIMRMAVSHLGAIFLGLEDYEISIKADLKKIAGRLPILSVRSLRDSLVPPLTIQRCFEGLESLDLRVVELAEGDHLEGLKKNPKIYTQEVKNFLYKISSKTEHF